jgi:hypothetical protein
MTPGRIAVLAALCALSAATSFAQEQRRTTPESRTTPGKEENQFTYNLRP